MKRPPPTVVEKLKAKQEKQSAPRVESVDLQNVLLSARRGLSSFQGADLVNISVSIVNLEAVVAALKPAPPAAETPPPAAPTEPAK